VPAPAAKRAAAPAGGGGGITVRELLSDKLMQAADANWRLPEGAAKPPLDDALVAKIYAEELGGGARAPSTQRASVLEISQVRCGRARRRHTLPHSDAVFAVFGAVSVAALPSGDR
jgi:hypothetical protein